MAISDKDVDEMLGDDSPSPVVSITNRTVAVGPRAIPRGTPPLARTRQEQIDAEMAEAERREAFISADPVVQNANKSDPLALLNALKKEVARETANLAYQRTINERNGKDASQLMSKRIDALKKIADIELEMRKIGVDQIDVYSEKFQRIVKLWIEMIQEAAVATLGPEQSDLFFNRLTSEMDGWEDKAAELVR